MITYDDIKAKRDTLKKTQREYVQTIRQAAKQLIDNYKASLDVSGKFWINILGEQQEYVYITQGGNYCELEDLIVELHGGGRFSLVTVIDDDPRAFVSVNSDISIYIEKEHLTVFVDGYGRKTFDYVDSEKKFNEISDFIKDSVLLSLDRLDFISTTE
ncbi:hypothetical protein ACM7X3_002873 [Escherichia coli]